MVKINRDKIAELNIDIDTTGVETIIIDGTELELDEIYHELTPALLKLKEMGAIEEVELSIDTTTYVDDSCAMLDEFEQELEQIEKKLVSYDLLYGSVINCKDDDIVNRVIEEDDEYYLIVEGGQLLLDSNFPVDLTTGNAVIDNALQQLFKLDLLTPVYEAVTPDITMSYRLSDKEECEYIGLPIDTDEYYAFIDNNKLVFGYVVDMVFPIVGAEDDKLNIQSSSISVDDIITSKLIDRLPVNGKVLFTKLLENSVLVEVEEEGAESAEI